MATYEEAKDNVTLLASEIVSRCETKDIVSDLYNVIALKCENGYLINELNGIERVFYLTETFEIEMCDGGLDQYYKKDSGNYANETVEALISIGAHQTALLLDRGNGVFKEGIVPEDCEERARDIEHFDYSEISWLFDELDQEFSKHKDEIHHLCLDYVLSHKEAFM